MRKEERKMKKISCLVIALSLAIMFVGIALAKDEIKVEKVMIEQKYHHLGESCMKIKEKFESYLITTGCDYLGRIGKYSTGKKDDVGFYLMNFHPAGPDVFSFRISKLNIFQCAELL
jgi:hypothetical protein